MFENRKYVIINTSEVPNIDFNQVIERDTDNLRYNNAGTKTIVKFEGNTPSFLNGKTQYNYSELLTKINESEWISIG